MKKILLLLCVIQLFSACSKKEFQYNALARSRSSDSLISESKYLSSEVAVSYDSSDNEVQAEETYNQDVSRKFIVTASLTLHLPNFEKVEAILTEIMGKYNAHTTETSIYNNVLYYTIRIPADIYKECFEELKTIGKVESFTESREDVTLNYYDLEGRLSTKRELMKKYREYLEKATNIEEIMAVEKQIAELQNEIERMGKDFTQLNNSIDFSTIRLVLNCPLNNNAYYTESIGDKIKTLFNGFGGYVSTTITILIGLIIYGIPTIIILFLLYLILLGKIGILKKVWRSLNGRKGADSKKV